MSAPDIFLSYNREDQARAKVFAESFGAQGFSVWWDVGLKTGEAYDEVTEAALRGAKAVVVLWSPRSVHSRWVRAEATLADRNKTLVPCMIEACERPIMFELTQTAELSHWSGEAADRAWLLFVEDVRRFVGREAQAAPASAAMAPLPAPKGERGERPSLAVMPFANRSGVAEDDALAFGMVEDVISAISTSPDVRVLASSATQRWAGKPADLRDVGRDLGVRYVLEGNTRRAGANLRVTVQLVEAETGAILWTQKFDRALSELAELQEDLVRDVAGRLGVAVQNLEMERALKKPGDITAYEACQRAWLLIGRQRPDEVARGVVEAKRAVAIAPDYGMAYGLLALGQALMARVTGDEILRAEALRNADEAVELSPNDASALTFASLPFLGGGRPRDAARLTRRALQINPNNGMAYGALGMAQIALGEAERGLANLETNRRLAPGDFGAATGQAYRASAYYQLGQTERAVEEIEIGFGIDAGLPPVLVVRAALCALTGRAADAAESVRLLRSAARGTSGEAHVRRLRTMGDMTSPAGIAYIAAFQKAWEETPE